MTLPPAGTRRSGRVALQGLIPEPSQKRRSISFCAGSKTESRTSARVRGAPPPLAMRKSKLRNCDEVGADGSCSIQGVPGATVTERPVEPAGAWSRETTRSAGISIRHRGEGWAPYGGDVPVVSDCYTAADPPFRAGCQLLGCGTLSIPCQAFAVPSSSAPDPL